MRTIVTVKIQFHKLSIGIETWYRHDLKALTSTERVSYRLEKTGIGHPDRQVVEFYVSFLYQVVFEIFTSLLV